MFEITIKQLLEAGVHFGHPTKKWNPKMAEYIFTQRNGIHIVDLQKTVKKFEEAYNYVSEIAQQGGTVLFVGTKKQAAETIKEEMEKHMPVVTGMFKGWQSALGTLMESDFLQKAYADCMNLSISYGVMEKTDKAWMYPAKFDWQDIGSWESLYNFIPDKDANGHVIGTERHLVENCRDGLVITPDRKKKMVAIKGLEDFMIIDTDDTLVICPKDDKKFKDFISQIGMPEFEKYR